jgi:hypothetical protein
MIEETTEGTRSASDIEFQRGEVQVLPTVRFQNSKLQVSKFL